MGMGAGVEIRVPLLDKEFLDWVNALPEEWKIRKGRQKLILSALAQRKLPEEVAFSPKKGSPTGVGNWLRTPSFVDDLEELVRAPDSLSGNCFDCETVLQLLEMHRQSRRFEHIAWCIFNLERWWRVTILDQSYGAVQ
jgi:asparagine synthase (glutamine-hydrolysing)